MKGFIFYAQVIGLVYRPYSVAQATQNDLDVRVAVTLVPRPLRDLGAPRLVQDLVPSPMWEALFIPDNLCLPSPTLHTPHVHTTHTHTCTHCLHNSTASQHLPQPPWLQSAHTTVPFQLNKGPHHGLVWVHYSAVDHILYHGLRCSVSILHQNCYLR